MGNTDVQEYSNDYYRELEETGLRERTNREKGSWERFKTIEDQRNKTSEQSITESNGGKDEKTMFGKWDEINKTSNGSNNTMLASTSTGDSYRVGSYEDMGEGVRTVNTMGEDLHTELASNDSMTYLKQDRAFMGPVADHFFDIADLYNKATDRNISDLESNSRTLAQINTNYQQTDAAANREMRDLV